MSPDNNHDAVQLRNFTDDDQGFRTIVEVLPLAVAVYRSSDRILRYANPALHKLFGLSGESLVGHDASFLIPRLPDRRTLDRKMASEFQVDDFKIKARRIDNGETMWINLSMRRVNCDDKECLLATMTDVTDRNDAQRDREGLIKTLQSLLQISDHDRQLIAYDIHDGVVQDMTAALMHLEAACKSIADRQESALQLMETAQRLLRDGIKEARRLIEGVQPPDVEQGGLKQALRNLVTKVQDTTGIEVELAADQDLADLPTALAVDIFRITQESLNNVWRHSHSAKARVALVRDDRGIEISVTDWGIGYDPSAVGGGHLGLRGIRDRAAVLGGTVSIDSKPGEGTTVSVQIPFANNPIFDFSI